MRICYHYNAFFILFIIAGGEEHAQLNSALIERKKELVNTLAIKVLQNGKLKLYKDHPFPVFTGHTQEKDINLE